MCQQRYVYIVTSTAVNISFYALYVICGILALRLSKIVCIIVCLPERGGHSRKCALQFLRADNFLRITLFTSISLVHIINWNHNAKN